MTINFVTNFSYNLMMQCWKAEHVERPRFDDVKNALLEIKATRIVIP